MWNFRTSTFVLLGCLVLLTLQSVVCDSQKLLHAYFLREQILLELVIAVNCRDIRFILENRCGTVFFSYGIPPLYRRATAVMSFLNNDRLNLSKLYQTTPCSRYFLRCLCQDSHFYHLFGRAGILSVAFFQTMENFRVYKVLTIVLSPDDGVFAPSRKTKFELYFVLEERCFGESFCLTFHSHYAISTLCHYSIAGVLELFSLRTPSSFVAGGV